jgi:cytidylate kinase
MENLLLKYFQQRMSKEELPHFLSKEPGPIITISREYGCPGKIIAQNLVERVNAIAHTNWKWISKEIIESLALELKLQPSVIQDIKNFDERKTTDYLALLFTNDYYPGEKKIKNTLTDIINSFAQEGKVVIVGRAGYQITNDIEKSIHVSLKAPIEWRIEHICQRLNLNFIDGMRQVEELSTKRSHFLSHFEKPNLKDYDLVFDCSQTNNDEITNVILMEMKKRNWI